MSVKLFVQHSHSICTAGKIEYKASTLPELNHYGKRHILGQSISKHVLCLNVVDCNCFRLVELYLCDTCRMVHPMRCPKGAQAIDRVQNGPPWGLGTTVPQIWTPKSAGTPEV